MIEEKDWKGAGIPSLIFHLKGISIKMPSDSEPLSPWPLARKGVSGPTDVPRVVSRSRVYYYSALRQLPSDKSLL